MPTFHQFLFDTPVGSAEESKLEEVRCEVRVMMVLKDMAGQVASGKIVKMTEPHQLAPNKERRRSKVKQGSPQ